MDLTNPFFISDVHFYHRNVIDYCNRPFGGVTEMHDHIIHAWNTRVGPRNPVFVLGDFSFRGGATFDALMKRLNGRLMLVHGNHDNNQVRNHPRWEMSTPYYELKSSLVPHKIPLLHFPIERWNKQARGAIHLHGHSHSRFPVTAHNRIDVGIDPWRDYAEVPWAPVRLSEILAHLKEKQLDS